MELNWSTFVLEIINFLVLVWLLKRFLYRPVTEVIARRKAGIDKAMEDAAARKKEAEELEARYQSRLTDWESERQQARQTLAEEIDAERKRRMADLEAELEKAREKARLADERRRQEETRGIEEAAIAQSVRFAARLLERVADEHTESQLIDLAVTSIDDLEESRLTELAARCRDTDEDVHVVSAYALDEAQRQRLETALGRIVGPDRHSQYREDPSLLAGLHVSLGAWVLKTNLRDELSGFAALGGGAAAS